MNFNYLIQFYAPKHTLKLPNPFSYPYYLYGQKYNLMYADNHYNRINFIIIFIILIHQLLNILNYFNFTLFNQIIYYYFDFKAPK